MNRGISTNSTVGTCGGDRQRVCGFVLFTKMPSSIQVCRFLDRVTKLPWASLRSPTSPAPAATTGRVAETERLGGMLGSYYLAAA